MSSQIGIWSVGEGKPARVGRSAMRLELDFENWVADDPSLIMDGIQIVGRQIHVEGGFIDLLALDVSGSWVVIELKRERLYRSVVIQAIDYASCIQHIESAELREKIEHGLSGLAEPEGVLERVDDQLATEDDDREVSVVVAGAGIDPGLERVVSYLAGFELPVRVVSFDVFQHSDGTQMLVREVLDEDSGPHAPKAKPSEKSVEKLRANAVAYGVVNEFDRIIQASLDRGLHNRPYKHTVTITPPGQRNRMLLWLTPDHRGMIRMGVSFPAFEEFFPPMTESEARNILGPEEGWHVSPGDPEGKVEAISALFEQLPEQSSADDRPSATAEQVFPYAALVEVGEWTTYGELSKAVTGSTSSSMAIGNLVKNPTFPNPQRVLAARGEIAEGWVDADGLGRDECKRRLEAEGLRFVGEYRVDPAQRIDCDELKSRLENENG